MTKKQILIGTAMLTAGVVTVILVSRQRKKRFDEKCRQRGGTVVKSGRHCDFKA